MDSTSPPRVPNRTPLRLTAPDALRLAASRVPWSTGMIFCFMALLPHWSLTASSSRKSAQRWDTCRICYLWRRILFRPLGGVIFGHFGDRLGRKRMLMLTVWMMGIATALIRIIPLLTPLAGGLLCCW